MSCEPWDEYAPERVGDKAATPELQPGVWAYCEIACHADDLVRGRRNPVQLAVDQHVSQFMADPVHGANVYAVGDGVGALNGLPGIVLTLPKLVLLGWVPADGGGVKERFRAFQSRKSRCFRVPLVPADQGANWARGGALRLEAEVAGREVELLVIERIVRDVHLAVDGGDVVRLARGVVKDRGRVVVQPRRTALKQARNQNQAVLANNRAERRRGWSRDRLGQSKEGMVLTLAEVLRPEKLG